MEKDQMLLGALSKWVSDIKRGFELGKSRTSFKVNFCQRFCVLNGR